MNASKINLELAFPGKGKELYDIIKNSDLDEIEKLEMIDGILGNYGIEHIENKWTNKKPFLYSNPGDPYITTVIKYINGNFVIRCWGDIVERGGYK